MTLPHRIPELDQTFRPSLFARLLFGLLLLSVTSAYCDPGPPLKIGLVRYLRASSTAEISCSLDFTIADGNSKQTLLTSTYLEPVTITIKSAGIDVKRADGKSVTADRLRIAPVRSDGLLTISTPNRAFSQYRGALEIRRVSDSALLFVNEIHLEDYLKGVLPAEMPSSFQIEALKAQAIAARTYSERSRGRHADSGFDLCDSDHCQVYLGSAGEAKRTTRAVMETTGIVAKYGSDLIWAVYSADCGGFGQSGADPAIARPEPYLKGGPDRDGSDKPDFCVINRTHRWTKEFTPAEMEAAINLRLQPPISGLKSIALCGYDDTGRVKSVDLVDCKGTRSLTGYEFRKACGPAVIRSLKMSMSTSEEGKICFEGTGWGHGVGMCQWGAEGLAREPRRWNYEQILKHYYRGIRLERTAR